MRIYIAAAALALTLAACSGGGQTTNPSPPPSPPPVGTTACPATITIGPGNSYSPSSCTIKVGQTVTISASGTHPLSGVGAGQNFKGETSNKTLGFSAAGTFNYVCDRHQPGMAGTITVEP
mgnify:CR=1 FL=1